MIKVSNLRKMYGEIEALKGISFSVAAGEIYGLLGPNGAGKSTTISILCGLLQPTSGTVYIGGLNLFTETLEVKRILGVVPQEVAFYKELSAYDNLMFYGSLYGLKGNELQERAREVIELVGLAHRLKDPVEKYSGGMMRRLNIACGIMHKPKVLLLDEPTVGIDPQTRLSILETIVQTAAQGTTVLFTTHYLDEAEEICRRVGIIDNGQILVEGTIDELRTMVAEKNIILVKGSFSQEAMQDKLDDLHLKGTEILSFKEGTASIAIPPGENNIPLLFKSLSSMSDVKEFNIKQPSLEALFIKLTGRELREQ
jgi:linearmycin/streptolysin S transport system ATP-binding protein